MSERRTTATIAGKKKSGDDCDYCGRTYAACTRKILTDRTGACCAHCGDYDTHDVRDEVPETEAVVERLRTDLAGSTPDYQVGTVIRFKIRYGSSVYTYAAIYTGNQRWYTTSRFDSAEHVQPTMDTRSLMRSLMASKAYDLEVASEWAVVPR